MDDPLNDDLYSVCDGCPSRKGCDLYASGQVENCVIALATSSGAVRDVSRGGNELDDGLEQKFRKMIRGGHAAAR